MITHSPELFLDALAQLPAVRSPAVPEAVFLVLPERFSVNPESAVDNAYMDLRSAVDSDRARAQAEALAALLRSRGLRVVTFEGRADTPDDVFPNNVFATAPGRLVVGRMRHAGRRPEAGREDIRGWFRKRGRALHDLSKRDLVAELTGAMVIDRARGVGFCGMTERVDEAGLEAMHRAFGLRLTFAFELAPGEYHANVVLSVLAGRACLLHRPAFVDPRAAAAVEAAFPGRALAIDADEKNAFVGNCIALTERDLFLSDTARAALRPDHRETLEGWGFRLHSTALDEIEKAGGSLRCMVAEIF
ncbi:MAG: arginine deiminase-related protein [Gammaproteobacteria bacterium]